MGPGLQEAWSGAGDMWMPEGRWTLTTPTVLEIGSGMGDSLIAASQHWDLAIGIDVHRRGLAATVRAARSAGRSNIRVVFGDAPVVLRECVEPGSLDEVHVWFPDPWPKTKHRKRRLVRPDVARLIADRLKSGGVLRLATDVNSYAHDMLAVLGSTEALTPLGDGGVVDRPSWRPITKYERAGMEAGRPILDLAFARTS